MVESSRSITAAVITAPNATQRSFFPPVAAAPAAAVLTASRSGVMVSGADDISSSVVSPVSRISRTALASVLVLPERNLLFQDYQNGMVCSSPC